MIVKCCKCGEELVSHAGRNWKFFHAHALGSYDGSSSGKCPIDGKAFEEDGTPIENSDKERKKLVISIHGENYVGRSE
jgi:hypothetical protein